MFLTELGLQFNKDIRWVINQPPSWIAHYVGYYKLKSIQYEQERNKR